MIYSHLREHAIRNVWCNPEQDNQVIVAAKRITPKEGGFISYNIMKRCTPLPDKKNRYHLFQIGQINPILIGMLSRNPDWLVSKWRKFSDSVNDLPLFANLYSDDGVSIPLHRSYYIYTVDRALIIAVDESNMSPINLRMEQVYLRLYTNAYYESEMASQLGSRTKLNGRTINSTNDILDIQNLARSYSSLPGVVFSYVNGHLVDQIDLLTAKIGDVVEFHYDASVKKVVDFHIKDTPSFESILDKTYKYLLHPPGKGDTIDYIDEIDAYVVRKFKIGEKDRYIGRYFHRNSVDSMRMVTHRDYAAKVHQFDLIARDLADYVSEIPLDIRDFYIRLYIREGGMKRPLIYDSNRIFELYKLSDEKIVRAMTGVDSSMVYWKAEELENSAYTELMRAREARDIDIDLIERAYGYNSITRIIADKPVLVKDYGTYKSAKLPIAHYKNSTVYEYDINGHLLEWHWHEQGDTYHCRNKDTYMVEAVYGKGSHKPSVVEGEDGLRLPKDNSYRVYMCYYEGSFPTRKWKDITGSDLYSVENGVLKWLHKETDQYLQIRTDEAHLAYNIDLYPVSGTFYFDLSEYINDTHRVMDIPMGDLDLWMNGRSLIYGLDYVVHFPRVYILSKEYLTEPVETVKQQVTIRFTGFCDKDLQVKPIEDFGWITHGMLSNDKEYDIRDDKVLRITVNGALRRREDLIFGELTEGISITDPKNGSPYQIKDVVVPLDFLAEEETYRLREEALKRDKAVEDYMTLKLPQPPRNAVSAIPNRYILMSPFFCHIVNDLNMKLIDRSRFDKELSDQEVIEMCKPYEGFLKFDPISPENNTDHRFVVIHPTERFTPIPLDLYSYRFLQRVVELYGRNLISLSPHVTINLGA